MDRPIEQKKWNKKRILTLVGILAIGGLIGTSYYLTTGNSRLNVEAERISIVEVKEGTFQEFIPINGTVLPINSIYLDASVGGRVEEKYVEDGAVLKAGDPIMRLSNTDQQLSLVQQETQVLNLLTQAQIARTSAEQVSINNRNQMADVEQALREAERVYKLNKKTIRGASYRCTGIRKINQRLQLSKTACYLNETDSSPRLHFYTSKAITRPTNS